MEEDVVAKYNLDDYDEEDGMLNKDGYEQEFLMKDFIFYV